MTNIQKVCCVALSLCFFGTLAITPGPFFLRENVYRQLPLYCFLEKKASEKSRYEDWETYEEIIEENGQYLGEKAWEEQKIAEGEKKEDKISGADALEPQEKNSSQDFKKENEINSQSAEDTENTTQEAVASIHPVIHPVIDLSPAKLADFNYLLGQFYIVDPDTQADASLLNAGNFLAQDLKIEKKSDTPQILIYHSHSQEAFADSRQGEEEDTIVGVGNYLTQILTETYGYQVVHVKEAFDMKSGEMDRSAAYDYARDYLTGFLEENPDIEVVIDLHRDGVPEDRHLVTEIDGKETAQIMFYNGLSYTLSKGKLDYLPNPYMQENLAFSFQLEYEAAQYYPDFYRGIYLAGYRYNQHFRPRSILLEAGAQTNTVQEVKNAMEPFAFLLDKVLNG